MQPAPDVEDHYTYRDYLEWNDDVRYELIDGRVYVMSPSPGWVHQDTAGELYHQLHGQLEGTDCRAFVAPLDVRLPKGDESDDAVDTVVQPDVLVLCDPRRLDEYGVRGAPELVIEVLSPHSAFHDHQRKRELYERAGVREYWLVDPLERTVLIYRLDEQGRYPKPQVSEMRGETPVGVRPGVVIPWEGLVGRLPPPG